MPDVVSVEVPISFTFEGASHTLWAWPNHLEDLVAGHSLLDLGGGSRTTSVTRISDDEFAVELGEAIANELEPGKLHGSEILEAMSEFMGKEGQWHGTG